MGIESKITRINHNHDNNADRLKAGKDYCDALGGNCQVLEYNTCQLHIINIPCTKAARGQKSWGFRIPKDRKGKVDMFLKDVVWTMKEGD
jgi:hypothetical protein